MPKSIKIYLSLLLLIFIGIIAIDANRDKPIDWTPTFAIKDKIPFGMYVFDQESETLFQDQKITKFGKSPFEFFDEYYNYADSSYEISGSVLFINKKMTIDATSVDELFYFTGHGNHTFLSCSNFPEAILDSLEISIEYNVKFRDSIQLNTGNKKFKPYYNKGISSAYFDEINENTTTILGTQKSSSGAENTNYIRVAYKNGFFYLHLQPIAFTNYYLLKNNGDYAAHALGFLPKTENVYWKIKRYETTTESSTPLRYILSQPALKWAFHLALLALFVFMFFNAKRRQRIIPIEEPLKNTTIDFTKTIGNLYFQEKNHLLIAEKKIQFLLEKIRNEYYIDTFNLDDTFINRMHQKTNRNKEDIIKLVTQIKFLRNQNNITEKQLIDFNALIEKLNL
ncbi:MAG: DUF4350 domain-containing protein [Flavobacterium sp.]|jgi:hypothetical protein|nr:DUF4350 domain-containing protein [Flavobacterium sp.]